MRTSQRILFVVNDAAFFLSHRLPMALAARDAGYEIHVATPECCNAALIRTQGFSFHPIPLSRRGMGVWGEVGAALALFRLYRSLQPDLVHHVTIKPVLYGGIAARMAGVRGVVGAVTGLGYVFVARGFKARLLRRIVIAGYRIALSHRNSRVVFQNPDDQAQFLRLRLVTRSQAALIRSSGVAMSQFFPAPEEEGMPLVVLASRMLWDKGVGEFVEAAKLLRREGVAARFALVGGSDPGNPASVNESQLKAWNSEGAAEWWGRRENMPYIFAQSHIVCLPSTYGEGVPKVLIEAAASGRPIVTTNAPGCREIVRDGENGLLVPVRDVVALAAALRRLIEDRELRWRMGARGREIAVTEFSVEKVVNETLAVYRELLV